jgi:hypothetical protein
MQKIEKKLKVKYIYTLLKRKKKNTHIYIGLS